MYAPYIYIIIYFPCFVNTFKKFLCAYLRKILQFGTILDTPAKIRYNKTQGVNVFKFVSACVSPRFVGLREGSPSAALIL